MPSQKSLPPTSPGELIISQSRGDAREKHNSSGDITLVKKKREKKELRCQDEEEEQYERTNKSNGEASEVALPFENNQQDSAHQMVISRNRYTPTANQLQQAPSPPVSGNNCYCPLTAEWSDKDNSYWKSHLVNRNKLTPQKVSAFTKFAKQIAGAFKGNLLGHRTGGYDITSVRKEKLRKRIQKQFKRRRTPYSPQKQVRSCSAKSRHLKRSTVRFYLGPADSDEEESVKTEQDTYQGLENHNLSETSDGFFDHGFHRSQKEKRRMGIVQATDTYIRSLMDRSKSRPLPPILSSGDLSGHRRLQRADTTASSEENNESEETKYFTYSPEGRLILFDASPVTRARERTYTARRISGDIPDKPYPNDLPPHSEHGEVAGIYYQRKYQEAARQPILDSLQYVEQRERAAQLWSTLPKETGQEPGQDNPQQLSLNRPGMLRRTEPINFDLYRQLEGEGEKNDVFEHSIQVYEPDDSLYRASTHSSPYRPLIVNGGSANQVEQHPGMATIFDAHLQNHRPRIPPRSTKRLTSKQSNVEASKQNEVSDNLQVGVYIPQLGFLPRSGDNLSPRPAAGFGTGIHGNNSIRVNSGQILRLALPKKSTVQVGDDRTGASWTPRLASGPNTGATPSHIRRKSRLSSHPLPIRSQDQHVLQRARAENFNAALTEGDKLIAGPLRSFSTELSVEGERHQLHNRGLGTMGRGALIQVGLSQMPRRQHSVGNAVHRHHGSRLGGEIPREAGIDAVRRRLPSTVFRGGSPLQPLRLASQVRSSVQTSRQVATGAERSRNITTATSLTPSTTTTRTPGSYETDDASNSPEDLDNLNSNISRSVARSPSPTTSTSSPSLSSSRPLVHFGPLWKPSSFLDKGIPARADRGRELPFTRTSSTMDSINRLTVRPQEASQVKAKAVEDARQMQAKVNEECKRTGKDPPPYGLEELIGKGSFGRVYKGKDMKSAAVVAVKIIDIDESDTINPRNADSYSEFLKEVNALKILSENNAKNINLVIEALPVNQAMWMITEYCGGGSVATLMKPTAPGGLNEKWIIPILREVAEAIKWVHQAGIIHRDIKCANVLVTEQGDVQLCDFGVAGIVESKLDKRSTIIGTPHWMAPELFGSSPSYGNEVDIWAFGSMVFEIATGLPPNVANGISYDRLGTHLKQYTPRLEGGDYSNNLRNLVAYCLEEDPKARPSIDQVQKHPYISNTSSAFPTSTLKALVGSFKVWESRGGSRKSLFMQHGAQGSTPSFPPLDDEWNFNGTEYFGTNIWGQYGVKDVIEAYGPAVVGFVDETTRPPAKVSRRRPPPEALSRLPAAPLEKIFDPNTLSNYEDNSRAHYGRHVMQSGSTDRSDLPLRDDSAQISIRDTMIDLGGHDPETGLSSFPDMDTIKAGRRGRDESEDEYTSTLHDFSRPALSDPAETNSNRRTQDWKFPSMAPPASADPELSRFPTTYEMPRPSMTPGSGGRPTLVHHPTEPVGAFGGGLGPIQPQLERLSMRESLIDLDMSLPDAVPEFQRPSTANSDVGSATSEQMPSGNPFELERHASLYQPVPAEEGREPSIYVSDETSLPPRLRNGNTLQELADMSDFSASDAEGPNGHRRDRVVPYDDSDDSYYIVNPGPSNDRREGRNRVVQYDGLDDPDYQSMPPPPVPSAKTNPLPRSDVFPTDRFPELPSQPSQSSLTGSASQVEMTNEITRMVANMSAQLEAFKFVYDSSDVVQRHGSNMRRERREPGTS